MDIIKSFLMTWWELAQSVICLVNKHDMGASRILKKPGALVHTCNPDSGEVGTGWSLGLLANQSWGATGFNISEKHNTNTKV